MGCEHEQVEYLNVAVPMEFHGVNFGTAHIPVMVCAHCFATFGVSEDGLREFPPKEGHA